MKRQRAPCAGAVNLSQQGTGAAGASGTAALRPMLDLHHVPTEDRGPRCHGEERWVRKAVAWLSSPRVHGVAEAPACPRSAMRLSCRPIRGHQGSEGAPHRHLPASTWDAQETGLTRCRPQAHEGKGGAQEGNEQDLGGHSPEYQGVEPPSLFNAFNNWLDIAPTPPGFGRAIRV